MLKMLQVAEWLYSNLLFEILKKKREKDVFIARFYKPSGGSASTQVPGPREIENISLSLLETAKECFLSTALVPHLQVLRELCKLEGSGALRQE